MGQSPSMEIITGKGAREKMLREPRFPATAAGCEPPGKKERAGRFVWVTVISGIIAQAGQRTAGSLVKENSVKAAGGKGGWIMPSKTARHKARGET